MITILLLNNPHSAKIPADIHHSNYPEPLIQWLRVSGAVNTVRLQFVFILPVFFLKGMLSNIVYSCREKDYQLKV